MGKENSAMQKELKLWLIRWAKAEPERCRRGKDSIFELLCAGKWLPVNLQPEDYGLILGSLLTGCHDHRIYCCIEYEPQYNDRPPTVSVGCIPRMFAWNDGDEAIASIPILLLEQYLERLQAG